MGRIFEKRKERMFARWSKTSKAFTKLGKEIAIAVKLGGPDPQGNPRLRMAMQTARSLNMPKDRIQNAIKRASSKDESGLQEVNYEAYGPHGVALFIETATDNPTRTVANVRNVFTKHGGALGTSGCLDFVFVRKGVFLISKPPGDLEQFELDLIDDGLEEVFETEDGLMLYSSFTDFGSLQRSLESRGIELRSAALQRIPLTQMELPLEEEALLLKMIDLLEDDDDVQHVYHTLKLSNAEH